MRGGLAQSRLAETRSEGIAVVPAEAGWGLSWSLSYKLRGNRPTDRQADLCGETVLNTEGTDRPKNKKENDENFKNKKTTKAPPLPPRPVFRRTPGGLWDSGLRAGWGSAQQQVPQGGQGMAAGFRVTWLPTGTILGFGYTPPAPPSSLLTEGQIRNSLFLSLNPVAFRFISIQGN